MFDSLDWERNNNMVRDEASKFPETFGLRAFPGKVFQISRTASYVSEGRVYLYVYIQNSNGWESFCKGTPAELGAQIVRF